MTGNKTIKVFRHALALDEVNMSDAKSLSYASAADLPGSTDLNSVPNSIIVTSRTSQDRLFQRTPRMRDSQMTQM